MSVIESLEREQIRDDIPVFQAGDTVKVHFRVVEGTRQRIMEGDVSRAKLYYLRGKIGKKARIREKQRN